MEKGFTIPVLDKGNVRYIRHLGSDIAICEAARISYLAPSKGELSDKKLIEYLWKNLHTSPFEQCSITFDIKMPIFVMRQFIRHRTFRVNEVSGRYSELKDEFYIPTTWRAQDNKNKQSSVDSLDLEHKCLTQAVDLNCHHQYLFYKDLLSGGVAREMARMVLPLNIYTEIYVNCDLHNLMHFLNLRLDEHAQYEIRVYAEAMKAIMKHLFPWTTEVFNKYKMKMVEV